MRSIHILFSGIWVLVSCGVQDVPQPEEVKPVSSATVKRKNKLAKEKSPYLQQHAGNPVDWYPWGEEAFARARKEDKPIFLSIGYSTCHWCHVMARESFVNEETAALLNESFVSIKVDREERPDVDQVYMTAAQVMTGGGGWPLSVWLTPDLKPFFVGTYFPPEDRFGRAGFRSVLNQLAGMWKTQREELLSSADRLTETLNRPEREAGGKLDKALLEAAYRSFESSFDEAYGGFGHAPKFPRSVVLEFLFRYHARTGNARALAMAEKTLSAMRHGGVYDQFGGGFHRYSTDEQWLVPHFEKMLYDNALLARGYTQAYQITGKAEYAQTVRETLDYVLRDMTSPEGAFYSAEDADSVIDAARPDIHAEGAFYVWTPKQITSVVPGKEGEIVARAFGAVEGGNVAPVEKDEPRGNSVLHRAATVAELAKEFMISEGEIFRILEEGRRKLFESRSRRPRPHRDEKILTDWNGLMIGAMAFAGAVLEEPRYGAAAERSAEVVLSKFRRSDGRLLHGDNAVPAFLDDHAYLAEGLLELYHATFKTLYLREAVRTAEAMIELFGDLEGAFYFSGKDNEKLAARLKDPYDGALPSGNSVAALALLRLGDLTSREDFRKKAEETLRSFAGTIGRHPPGYPYHLCALDALLGPSREVVLAGAAPEMLRALRQRYLPNTVVAVVPPSGPDEATRKLIPMTEGRPAVEGKPTAYVCENSSCKVPTTSLEELIHLLEKK